MEFKGTKGKWFIDIYESNIMSNGVFCNVISTEKTMGLADVYGKDEQSKANALLISKAPEMLEMLKDLLKWSAHFPPAMDEELEKAKQLIKEATEI